MFAMMVELFEAKGIERALHYLPKLRKEYAFWMEGADELRRGEARRHCLRLDDGTLLNRYWDDRRSEEHTSELQSLMRISYAVFCLKKKTTTTYTHQSEQYKKKHESN